MTGRDWFDAFVAQGPDYDALRMSVSEVQALLLKAAIGDGLPLGYAQDLSGLARLLMSDPQLIAMAAAALDGRHPAPVMEGTDDHVVFEQAQIVMVAPLAIDMIVAGADRVVLQTPDWPLLLWPYLAQAQQVYELTFGLADGGSGAVIVSRSDRNVIDPFAPIQAVPGNVVDRLAGLAAKTYVPASEASRLAGAGAGLTDND